MKILGGKVSAWQDKDGDWIETGSAHILGRVPEHDEFIQGIKHRRPVTVEETHDVFRDARLPGGVYGVLVPGECTGAV